MSDFDQDAWERRWAQVLSDHADRVAARPPNADLVAEASQLAPGRALDAGCGHGSEAVWLALRGWRVTAVDFSTAALAYAESTAAAIGADIAEKIEWLHADLTRWSPAPRSYDLVACLYVHASDSVDELVRRLAGGVAPGGTLFLVGHQPIDPATGEQTAAATQDQVSVDATLAALDPADWTVLVAEERPRSIAGTGVDAVIRAQRRS